MKKKVFELWQGSTTMTYYEPDEKKSNCAVIIFPGGGYAGRAEHEGEGYAKFLTDNGICAFAVDYRVAPSRFPLPLLDARRSIRFVRYNSEKFGVDKNKIAVMGSSAGGHLAALVSTYTKRIEGEGADLVDEEEYLPNGQILAYPVITLYDSEVTHIGSGDCLLGDELKNGGSVEKRKALSAELLVNSHTPTAFIWHTFDDELVDVRNTLWYAESLKRYQVPAEVHIFPHGRHGLGLANDKGRNEPHVALWGDLLLKWIDFIGW